MGVNMTEALTAERIKQVAVRWTYPKSYERILVDERVYGIGLYCISRKFGSKETLLYIGQTTDCFYNRLVSHKEEWLHEVRGRIFIRLGIVERPSYRAGDALKRVIEDAERVLIYEMQPPCNYMATVSYTPNHLYSVVNTGFRGSLPRLISMREHIYR